MVTFTICALAADILNSGSCKGHGKYPHSVVFNHSTADDLAADQDFNGCPGLATPLDLDDLANCDL